MPAAETNIAEGPPPASAPPRAPGAGLALRWLLVWLFALGALAALRSHTFYQPIEHDEAIFLYGGQAWAAGEVPYRDFWDHKPPHVFLFHSIPLRLFPFSRTAVLVFEILYLALAATLFAAVCRLHLSRLATFIGVAFFIFFVSHRTTIRSGGLTEETALAFVALCYFFILRSSRRLWLDALLAGLCLGMAAEFRQTFAPLVLFLAAAIIWRGGRTDWQSVPPLSVPSRFKFVFGAWLFTGLGFALPELFWSSYFALHGAWHEYIEASYLFNFFYIGSTPEQSAGLTTGLLEHEAVLRATGPVLAAPFLALIITPWLPGPKRWLVALGLLAFVCEFLPISISGEYYRHYYVQATVSSCLLLALAAEGVREIVIGLARRSRESRAMFLKYSAGAAMAGIVLTGAVWLTINGVKAYAAEYQKVLKRAESRRNETSEQASIGQAIARLTDPDDRILLLGVQPNAAYFAAKRYAGARYFHNAPLFKGKFQESITPAMRERMMADLAKQKPALVILGPIEGPMESWRGLAIFDERKAAAFLRPWLEAHYVPLEDVVKRIPKEWTWYQDAAGFMIRKDRIEDIKARIGGE